LYNYDGRYIFAQIKLPPGLAQNPDEVFYKTSTGRKDMPKFEKKIPDDEDRWALVHYIMNLYTYFTSKKIYCTEDFFEPG